MDIYKCTEKEVIISAAKYFKAHKKWIFPNVFLCGGEMDLAIVTKSKMLWEVEIKLTLADWKSDEHKEKWNNPDRKYVSRFYYLVPEALILCIPDFVPQEAGILFVPTDRRQKIKVFRKAKSKHVKKITKKIMRKLYKKMYFKFWNYAFKTKLLTK